MPLTEFQKEVLSLLAKNRNPNNYVAGGTAINRSSESPRYSADFDFFHDTAESVAGSATQDALTLEASNYHIEWLMRQPAFYRARISKQEQALMLDWAFDSAFRFFPVMKDVEFGYVLHQADLATNKILALANRSEIRDFLDILFLDEHYLRLGAICWAACGKDQGFTPNFLLESVKRNATFREADLESLNLAISLSLVDLKKKWLSAIAAAEKLVVELPAQEVGCFYLNPNGDPITPNSKISDFQLLLRHFGSVKGAWPTIGS